MTILQTDNQFEYIDGQLRPHHAALFDQFAAANQAAVATCQPALDIPYGPHPRQRLDLFRASGARCGAIAYFHAGYWQSRDKGGFRFLAPPLTADGFDVALVNYPLSPEADVPGITEAAQASLATIAGLTDHAPLVLAGHSAGAQLAIDLALDPRTPAGAVAGILAISGVFDLEPLIGTTVNDKLGLTPATARAASPLHRVRAGAPPAIFAVGALETASFREQTARMAQAWAAAGNRTNELTVPDCDHFSILTELSRERGVLRQAVASRDAVRPTV